MKGIYPLVIGGFLSILLLVSLVIAATDTDTSTLDVTVGSVTMIDLNASAISFTVNPGTTSTAQYLTVEDVGSTNLTSFYANVTHPTSNPFGGGVSVNYNAGNFLKIANSTGGYMFVDRKEYNRSIPNYVVKPSGAVAEGSFKNGNVEYFWALKPNATSGDCTDGGTAAFYITDLTGASAGHNKTQTGDIDIAANSNALSGDAYGAADVSIDGNGYCVVVDGNCTYVRIIKFNTAVDSESVCTNDVDIWATGIQPGDVVELNVTMAVPFGTAEGAATQGTLTIIGDTS